MKIVLIGFMGSGKTTISKLLATTLSLPCYEIDDLTTNLTKVPIREFIDKFGEEKFRAFEKQAIGSLSNLMEGIISTGGGSVLDPENQTALFSNNARVIYLKTSFDSVKQRLANDSDRPLFRDPEKARLLYQQRAPLYEKLAYYKIETDSLTTNEIADQILRQIV